MYTVEEAEQAAGLGREGKRSTRELLEGDGMTIITPA